MLSFVTIESAKSTVELLTAVIELAKKLRESPDPSLTELFSQLREETLGMVKALDRNLDQIVLQCDRLGIDVKRSFRDAESEISRWNLIKRYSFRHTINRIGRLFTAVKSLYSDIEAIFACAKMDDGLFAGATSADLIRAKLNEVMLGDRPIIEVIDALRKPLNEMMTQL